MNREKPVLYIIVPCYNEEKVLPITSKLFEDKLKELERKGKISEKSRVLYVSDGSRDKTWDIISDLADKGTWCLGISQITGGTRMRFSPV